MGRRLMNPPIPNRKYIHYKGGLYQVLLLAEDTVTKEPVVVYKSITWGTHYTRPLKEWNMIIKEDNPTTRIKRFELYDDNS